MIQTKVGNQVYSGGKGKSTEITVTGNSKGEIIGTNTEINQYGDSSLGAVSGDVDIFFYNYEKTTGSNKYKTMSGINKDTNIYLVNSYVYLTGGLNNIENLNIPKNSGMMISENTTLDGNFNGGGEIDIQSGKKLIVNGDLSKAITKLTIRPSEDEKENLQIIGGEENPYIVVLGKDENDIVSNEKTGMISGNTSKYTIRNNPEKDYIENDSTQKASEYYITSTVKIGEGITEKIYNVEDKVFTSEIDNTDKVYILNNGAFTSKMNISYEMIRQANSDGKWKFADSSSMKNLRRYIYLADNNDTMKLPANTKITMITNGKYYNFIVPDNYGTSDFWNRISSSDLGVTENLGNKLPLCLFKDDNGNKFTEVENIQDKMNLNDDNITNILTTSEDYRFIVDFFNCTNKDIVGNYKILLDAIDYKENSTKDNLYAEYEQINSIKIEDRNYNIEISKSHDVECQKVNMKFGITFTANEISELNKCDSGKNIKLRISLLNSNSQIITIPDGTLVIIDGKEYNAINNEIIYTLIDSVNSNDYNKTIDLQIDMKNVADLNLIADGKYYLNVDAYLSDGDNLLENNSIVSKKAEFTFEKVSKYGIKVNTNNSKLIFN